MCVVCQGKDDDNMIMSLVIARLCCVVISNVISNVVHLTTSEVHGVLIDMSLDHSNVVAIYMDYNYIASHGSTLDKKTS